jgi:hypothetical protein
MMIESLCHINSFTRLFCLKNKTLNQETCSICLVYIL